MAFPIGSIPITGAVGVTAPSDSYPTHLASLGKGGLRAVATIAERNAIPIERREQGMQVYVQSENMVYTWYSEDLTGNASWIRTSIFTNTLIFFKSLDFGLGTNKLDFIVPEAGSGYVLTGSETVFYYSFFLNYSSEQEQFYIHGASLVQRYVELGIGIHMTAYVVSGVLSGIIPDMLIFAAISG